MKIGLVPVNVGVNTIENAVGLASYAESLGFESLWTFEHVIVPLEYNSRYPYDKSGKMGVTPEVNFVDPLICLAAIAQHTTKVKLATGVNILPQANPLLLAKQCASLDFVSNGRFMLGVGIGWLEEEFKAMGVPFEKRGARFDDYIQAMRKVWSGDEVDHTSEFLDWQGFQSRPAPQAGRDLPVIIGGTKGKAFERIAKHGQGWFAPTNAIDQLEALLPRLNSACEAEGRDPASVEITAMWIPAMEDAEHIARYEALGVDRLIVPLHALGENPADALAKFGEDYKTLLDN